MTYTYMGVVRMTTEAWFAFFAFLMMLLMHYDSRNMVIDKRRRALVLSLPVIVLFMIGDIFAVYYRGDPSGLGYWMVRLGNGVYFLAGLVLVELLGEYLGVQVAETGEETYSMAFKWINRILALLGIVLLLVSQFTDLYYWFDESNRYHRGQGFWIYVALICLGFLNIFIYEIRYRKRFTRAQHAELIMTLFLPFVFFALQTFQYGSFLMNVGVAVSILLFVIVSIFERNRMIAAKEQEIQEMETRLLLSQIQPHFLFNSLTAIQSLILDRPEEAYEAVGDFSDFLRGVLSAVSQQKTVSVSEDLETAAGYLRIEKLRFGDALEVDYEIEDRDFRVPPLTIQPIAENAVRHGLRKKEGGGTLKLRVYRDQKGHWIEVRDDGVGFDPEKVGDDGQIHIGIENVRSRIRHLCDGEMTIESEAGKGTSVKMWFPD